VAATLQAEVITTSCGRPVERPVMLQGWHDLTSVHWPYDPDVVQRLLPDGLRVDTCEGSAWVGLIPFQMRRIRVPGLPALGAWSTFPETNIRSYVVDEDGRRAVWFHSLDVSRLAPAVVARVTYGLPYCWASMSITHPAPHIVGYSSARRWPRRGPASRVEVEIGESIDETELGEVERFITARWALASRFAGRNLWADVDHEPWPLHRARLVHLDESLIEAAGLPAPVGRPVVLWSPGVDVRIGRPHRLRSSSSTAPGGTDLERG
jgi:uncharacterized protein YqjF (DUF2071 family)